ncbi:MAG: PilZ domain-containing protein [Bacteroidota bacterium]|nr:PilZ domain-containing protein [Bacteroidota bacterium]
MTEEVINGEQMNMDPKQKMLDYIDALEKTNKSMLTALQKLLGYSFTIEKDAKNSTIYIKSERVPTHVPTFGKPLQKPNLTSRLVELITDMPEDKQQALVKDLEKETSRSARKHHRKPFIMVVDYMMQDRMYKDFIQDISAGGLFIETNKPFPIGQNVILTFPLPDYQEHIKITGEVVRSTPQGIGVKFKMADEDQETMVKSLLDTI